MHKRVVIVAAGPNGWCLATVLAMRDLQVMVPEPGPDTSMAAPRARRLPCVITAVFDAHLGDGGCAAEFRHWRAI